MSQPERSIGTFATGWVLGLGQAAGFLGGESLRHPLYPSPLSHFPFLFPPVHHRIISTGPAGTGADAVSPQKLERRRMLGGKDGVG